MRVEVLAGDFPKGELCTIAADCIVFEEDLSAKGALWGFWYGLIGKKPKLERIPFCDIEEVALADEESSKSTGGGLGFITSSGVVFGASGSKKQREVIFTCRFKDGRKVMGKTNSQAYQALLAGQFDAKPVSADFQRFIDPQASKNKAKELQQGLLGLVFLIVIVAIAMKACKSDTPKEAAKPVDPASKVPASILDQSNGYDQKNYPKLYKQWGKKGIATINEMLPKAALQAAKSSSCDKVEVAEVSSRSKPPSDIIFFVDCANHKRFMVSADDIKNDKEVIALQDQKIDELAALKLCDPELKARMKHPSTFDGGTFNVSMNNVGYVYVTRNFSAKNSFGLELEYQGECVFTDDGIEVSITEK